MKRTRNPAPTATGQFATATIVEWIGVQRCKTSKRYAHTHLAECEGSFEGNSYCWRHDNAWDSAKRLLRWQVQRPAPRCEEHYSYYCGRCKDTGDPNTFSFEDAIHILGIRTPQPWERETCEECPRCVVCSVEASLHSETQEDKCARELAETGPSLLPRVMALHHWVPRLQE